MGICDKIFVRGLRFYGRHGVHRAEKELGQRFEVDVRISADLQKAGRSDVLEHTLDYTQVVGIVKQAVEGTPKNLVESVAEEIAHNVLSKMPLAQNVSVTVSKPHVAISAVLDSVGVEIFRKRHSK